MKVLTGHLTSVEKKAIKAMFEAGVMEAKIGKKNYFMSEKAGVYTVKVQQKDRGLIPCGGSVLRVSTYTSTFSL